MTKTKTQRLKYHVSIPELLDTVERDSVTASLCWNDMDTRMRLGESQSSVEESELAHRCRNARERVSQARKDMLSLFEETRDVHLDCYRKLKAERDGMLAALEGVMDMLELCQHTGSIPERLANLDTWKDRTESANAAITSAKAGGAK